MDLLQYEQKNFFLNGLHKRIKLSLSNSAMVKEIALVYYRH